MATPLKLNERRNTIMSIPLVNVNEGPNFIGARVGYLDFLGIPHTGKVVYQKPHKIETDILYFGIELDEEENSITIVDGNNIIYVGAYMRSDEVKMI